MTCTTATCDKTHGFDELKSKTKFLNDFFDNAHPTKISQFRQIVLNKQAKNQKTVIKKNPTQQKRKNILIKKSKLSEHQRNKIDKLSELDRYKVYTRRAFLKNR